MKVGLGLVKVYLVEGSGCGGCFQEALAALLARPYRRPGVAWVEAPAHADLLLWCGRQAGLPEEEVRQLLGRFHRPWACLRLGDCGAGEKAVLPGREVFVAGCPPGPEEILAALEAIVRGQEAGSSEEST